MHNYLMITSKIGKVICPVCDVKNSNRAFGHKKWGNEEVLNLVKDSVDCVIKKEVFSILLNI